MTQNSKQNLCLITPVIKEIQIRGNIEDKFSLIKLAGILFFS